MTRIEYTRICLLIVMIVVGSMQTVYADEYIKLPILVNIQGFEPEEFEGQVDDIKFRVTKNIADANSILAQCAQNHGTATLKIGDPENDEPQNIVFVENPRADSEPEPGTPAWRDLVNRGKEELNKRFGPGKGQKLYIVKGGLGGKDGRGQTNEPVAWVKNDSLLIEIRDGPVGRDGNILIHEFLHNSGQGEDGHTNDDGTVMDDPREPNDRRLTKEQCEDLERYFRSHGLVQPNEHQQTGFVPNPPKTHHAGLFIPATGSTRDPALGMIEISITNGILEGRFTWDGLIPSSAEYVWSIMMKADFDDNPITGLSTPPFAGVDGFIELEFSRDESGFGSLAGWFNLFGQSNGEVEARTRLEDVSGTTSHAISNDGNAIAISDVFTFHMRMAGIPNVAENVPVWVIVASNLLEQKVYRLDLSRVPPLPSLTTFPGSAVSGAPYTVAGTNFSPNSRVRIFLNGEEISSVVSNNEGAFSTSVDLPNLAPGDYFLEAVDRKGLFAIGILTILEKRMVETALDLNGDNFINDDEILKAIALWVTGEVVPGTNQTLDDERMLSLIRMWILHLPLS